MLLNIKNHLFSVDVAAIVISVPPVPEGNLSSTSSPLLSFNDRYRGDFHSTLWSALNSAEIGQLAGSGFCRHVSHRVIAVHISECKCLPAVRFSIESDNYNIATRGRCCVLTKRRRTRASGGNVYKSQILTVLMLDECSTSSSWI